MNVLQVMGCTSDQYASMERYLVEKANYLSSHDSKLFLTYENTPKSEAFVQDFSTGGGYLSQNKVNGPFDFSSFGMIYRLMKKQDIGLVHTYFTPTCHYVNFFLALRGFRQVVRTAANLPVSLGRDKKRLNRRSKIYLSLRHKWLAMAVKKILCRSEGVKKEFQELGVSAKKIAVVPGGVDTEEYLFRSPQREKMREELRIDERTLVLGVFSRLVLVKRIERLIQAFGVLSQSCSDVKLLVAGDGPERSDLKSLAHALRLDDRISFLGHREDISRLYSALDIFCLPSKAEGMSNSILEAMATGLPVVASDIPPNRELVEEGRGGYLIDFGQSPSLLEKVEILSDEGLRKTMGAYNREKVVSRFSLKSRIEKEFQIYREISA